MSTFCIRCGESLVNSELRCPFCIGERREAVKALVAAAPSGGDSALLARVEAIDTLRNLGHSQVRPGLGKEARELLEVTESPEVRP